MRDFKPTVIWVMTILTMALAASAHVDYRFTRIEERLTALEASQ